MSAALHLCGPEELDRLLPLVAAFHEEMGFSLSDEHRRAALAPLLEGAPQGAAYLIGPAKAPIGYLVVSFGWSIELGGLDGMLDEIYLRSSVRGRGIGTEVLHMLLKSLGKAGLKGLSLEVDGEHVPAWRFYQKAGFERRDRYILMTAAL